MHFIEAVVRGIFYLIYYPIALAVSVIVLVFWITRLIITIAMMVFAMLWEAWRNRAISERPMKIIENVLHVGPAVIAIIFRAPFRKDEGPPQDQASDLIFEIAYAAVFLILLATIYFSSGFIFDLGAAFGSANNFGNWSNFVIKFASLYFMMSFGVVVYLLVSAPEIGRVFKGLVVPAYLIISGFLIVLLGAVALGAA